MSLLYAFWVEIKRQVQIMRSYGFNTLVQIGTLAVFFGMLYFGARFLVGPGARLEATTEVLIVGYWVWSGLLMAVGDFSWNIITYAEQGLLEQLFMTPWRLARILALQAAAGLVVNLGFLTLLLGSFMALSGHWLRLEPVTTLTLYILTLLPAYGLGYILAGLAMRFKNIQSVFNIVQFLFVPLQALPVDRYPWLNVLPFAQGTRMLLEHARHGTPLWGFSWENLAILVAQAVVYLALGLAVYHPLESAARDRGLLAHY